MVNSSIYVKNWRKQTKERMVIAMGGKCNICNYSKCMDALEFHHIDPSQKDFSLSSIRANPKSWESIVKELKKCILVCSNCHKEIHAGIATIPANYVTFANEWENYSQIEKEMKQTFCPICKEPKRNNQKHCSLVCSGKNRLKIDWSQYDLPELSKTMSNVAIGRMIGVSDVAIYKRLKKIGSSSR